MRPNGDRDSARGASAGAAERGRPDTNAERWVMLLRWMRRNVVSVRVRDGDGREADIAFDDESRDMDEVFALDLLDAMRRYREVVPSHCIRCGALVDDGMIARSGWDVRLCVECEDDTRDEEAHDDHA